ncbi:MAG: NADPH dehydrogenase NamA [Eubacteriaceae bacterium]|nr:NADPH dehydrogenase NamA [Eubacteriaceae bacterium]
MSKLFSPIQIKNMKLRNRVVMPPMCMYSAGIDGIAKDFHLLHYASRAMGGVGLIIQEATGVESRGRISENDLGIWKDDQIEGLRKIVTSCKSYGAAMGIQLGHAGRKSEVKSEGIVAPSALAFSDKYPIPQEMTVEDIQILIQAFKAAAVRCIEIGYDFIEIHGAHGYLINQFMSPLTNKRTDQYGGSLKNRGRLLLEVVKAVREVWPEEKPLGIRVSAEEYDSEGNHPEDVANLINLVKGAGVDLINVSSGGVVSFSIKLFQGYQIKFAEIVKEKTSLPVIAGGLIVSSNMAEEILQNNRADLIFLGRALLRNPYWPLQADWELDNEFVWPEPYIRGKIVR